MMIKLNHWYKVNLFLRKIIDPSATVTIIDPLNISAILIGRIINEIYTQTDAIKSQNAGITNKNGFILVLKPYFIASSFSCALKDVPYFLLLKYF